MRDSFFKKVAEIYDGLYKKLDDSLFSVIIVDDFTKEIIRTELIDIINEDIMALVSNDPAARFNNDIEGSGVIVDSDVEYVLISYKCLQAVIDYRIANYLLYYHTTEYAKLSYSKETLLAVTLDQRKQARVISEESKVQTAIEIHPAAKIGRRFVIDHGYGTVIGETCEIGNDCYILQGVVLGAKGMKNNSNKRRHPKIGNHVEIAGGVRIFGDVIIGDNVKIYAHAIVTQDVPANSHVRVMNQIQITTPQVSILKVYGVIPENDGVSIIGDDLNTCNDIILIDSHGDYLDRNCYLADIQCNKIFISFRNPKELVLLDDIKHVSFLLLGKTNQTMIKDTIGWKVYIDNIKNS